MAGNSTTLSSGSGSGSGSGSSSGGGSADYATEAGHALSAHDVDVDSPAYSRWLRKDIADAAAEVITFAKGIISTLRNYFNGGATIAKDSEDTGNALVVTGGTQTDTLTVSSNASVGGNLGVNGDTTIDGTLEVADNVTIDGDTSVAGNLTTESNFSADGHASVGGNLGVTGNVTAAQVIADALKTPEFRAAVGMIGLGFGVTKNVNGKATLQTDDLLVLGRMIVNSLNIREVSYIGGTYLLTPAASTIAKVLPLYTSNVYKSDTRYWATEGAGTVVGYRLMWLADDGSVGTMNYWHQGDQAFCQTFNITEPGEYTNVSNQYYWRLVCRVGQMTVTENNQSKVYHYADVSNQATVYLYDSNDNQLQTIDGSYNFVGYEPGENHSTPAEGDKVVALGSQYDTTRGGAVQITAEGTASIGIYDNIQDYTPLTYREIHYLSKEQVRMRSDMMYWRSSGGTLQTQADYQTSVNTSISEVRQTAESIELSITNKLGQTGINISGNNRSINLQADKVTFSDSQGGNTDKIYIDPTTGTLVTENAIIRGATMIDSVMTYESMTFTPNHSENLYNFTTGTDGFIDKIWMLANRFIFRAYLSIYNTHRLDIYLPPAEFLKGQTVLICNSVYEDTSTGDQKVQTYLNVNTSLTLGNRDAQDDIASSDTALDKLRPTNGDMYHLESNEEWLANGINAHNIPTGTYARVLSLDISDYAWIELTAWESWCYNENNALVHAIEWKVIRWSKE